jgi:hypothetical protein
LDGKAEHDASEGWVVKPDLELETGCRLATDSQDVGWVVEAVVALEVVQELGADEAAHE